MGGRGASSRTYKSTDLRQADKRVTYRPIAKMPKEIYKLLGIENLGSSVTIGSDRKIIFVNMKKSLKILRNLLEKYPESYLSPIM